MSDQTIFLPVVKRGRRTLIPRLAFEHYVVQLNQQALSSLIAYEPVDATKPYTGVPAPALPKTVMPE